MIGEKYKLALIIISCILVLSVLKITDRLDYIFYDNALKLSPLTSSHQVAVIAIDEQSIQAIGHWPWRRRIHAALLDKLASTHTRAIGVDLIFSEPSMTHPKDDIALANAIKRLGNVVLPIYYMPEHQGGTLSEIRPLPLFSYAANRLGHIHVELDKDGIVRGFFLFLGKSITWPALSLALTQQQQDNRSIFNLTDGHKTKLSSEQLKPLQKNDFRLIPFSKVIQQQNTYSYIDVLTGKVPLSTFTNKVVLIGATAAGLGDFFPTPISGKLAPTPGVFIHANAVSGILTQSLIQQMSSQSITWLSMIVAMLPLLFYGRISPGKALFLSMSLAFLYFLACMLLLNLKHLWLPPTLGIIGLLIAYPLWSRQKLMQLNHFLDEELNRLNKEPILIKTPTSFSDDLEEIPRSGEKIADQIAKVRTAIRGISDMRHFITYGFENMPDGVILTDSAGIMIFVNSHINTWFPKHIDANSSTPDSWENNSITDFLNALPEQQSEPLNEWIQNALAKRIASFKEIYSHEKDYLFQLLPVSDTPQQQLGIILNVSDISELKQQQREKDRLISFLSHDVRSPLVSQLAMLEGLQSGRESITKNSLETLANHAKRSLKLAEHFLQVARAEQLDKTEFIECEINNIIENGIDEVTSYANSKQIQIHFKFEKEIWTFTQAELLERAIINLLNNAIKYSDHECEINITLNTTSHNIQICISDEGVGIDEENRQLIFHPFRRLPNQSANTKGSGLGLYFVKTVIEKHQGSIRVYPAHQGQGSIFEITLPYKRISTISN